MGIFGASKEYIDALDEKQRQVVRGIAKTVELQGTNIARLTGRADSFQRLITELTDKVVSWGKITAENTRQIGELIDRLSTLSADLAELDKRVCQLEKAQSFTMEAAVSGGPRLEERDKAFSPNAILVPKLDPRGRAESLRVFALPGFPSAVKAEPKPDRTRVSSRQVAETMMRTDKDVPLVIARACAAKIDESVAIACVAANVVAAVRNNGIVKISVHERRETRPNRIRFYTTVRVKSDAQSRQVWTSSQPEAEMVANQMRTFVEITRNYFHGVKP